MWIPKNDDLDNLRAPKSIKFEAIFDADLTDFKDDGDKQCIESNALCSEELMVFLNYLPQFCLSVAVWVSV